MARWATCFPLSLSTREGTPHPRRLDPPPPPYATLPCPTNPSTTGSDHTARCADTQADLAVALVDFAAAIAPPPTTTTPTRPYPREAAPLVEPGCAHFDSDGLPQTQTPACRQATVLALSTWAATRCTRVHLFPSLETHPSGKLRAPFFCSVCSGIMWDSSVPVLPVPVPIASANAPANEPSIAPVVLFELMHMWSNQRS